AVLERMKGRTGGPNSNPARSDPPSPTRSLASDQPSAWATAIWRASLRWAARLVRIDWACCFLALCREAAVERGATFAAPPAAGGSARPTSKMTPVNWRARKAAEIKMAFIPVRLRRLIFIPSIVRSGAPCRRSTELAMPAGEETQSEGENQQALCAKLIS